eukprot:12881534-Heterocapsa_arctica.AAC.1
MDGVSEQYDSVSQSYDMIKEMNDSGELEMLAWGVGAVVLVLYWWSHQKSGAEAGSNYGVGLGGRAEFQGPLQEPHELAGADDRQHEQAGG